ncbi:MAG: guanylate kinase [Candidatus Omnitrophica bacterium]|nr:guanylate kinase [Candidatus Omnitrophota bacterium]
MMPVTKKKNKGKIFIISGPSGVGKTTLFQRVIKLKKYCDKIFRSISVTSRSRRKGERDGRDYFFVSPKMFEYKIRAGHFLEWERVFDHYYGTPKKKVKDLTARGDNVLLCVDVKGAQTVRKKFKRVVSIFIKPPSMEELQKRLNDRGSESGIVQKKRLARVKQELNEAKYFDHIVINDQILKAVNQLDHILENELFIDDGRI